MKRRLQKKYIILILGYSVALILIPYVLDYRSKSSHIKDGYQQQKCPDLDSTIALWSSTRVGNSTEVEDYGNRSQSRTHIYLHATWRTGSSFLGLISTLMCFIYTSPCGTCGRHFIQEMRAAYKEQ